MLRYTRYGGDFGLLDGPPVPADNVSGPLRRVGDNRLQLTSNTVLGGVRLETKSQWQRHALQELVDQSRVASATPTFDLLLNTFSTDVLLHHAGPHGLTATLGVSDLFQDNQTRGTLPLVPPSRTTGGAAFVLGMAALGRWTVVAGPRGGGRQVRPDSTAPPNVSAPTPHAAPFPPHL